MDDVINASIERLIVLEIDYDPGFRTVEPHAYGRGADGQRLLRVYQTAGASASGEHEHWKLLRVDRIRSARLKTDQFDGPRPGYKRGDKAMKGGIIREL